MWTRVCGKGQGSLKWWGWLALCVSKEAVTNFFFCLFGYFGQCSERYIMLPHMLSLLFSLEDCKERFGVCVTRQNAAWSCKEVSYTLLLCQLHNKLYVVAMPTWACEIMSIVCLCFQTASMLKKRKWKCAHLSDASWAWTKACDSSGTNRHRIGQRTASQIAHTHTSATFLNEVRRLLPGKSYLCESWKHNTTTRQWVINKNVATSLEQYKRPSVWPTLSDGERQQPRRGRGRIMDGNNCNRVTRLDVEHGPLLGRRWCVTHNADRFDEGRQSGSY